MLRSEQQGKENVSNWNLQHNKKCQSTTKMHFQQSCHSTVEQGEEDDAKYIQVCEDLWEVLVEKDPTTLQTHILHIPPHTRTRKPTSVPSSSVFCKFCLCYRSIVVFLLNVTWICALFEKVNMFPHFTHLCL